MSATLLGSSELVQVIRDFHRQLTRHEQMINRLNVFPVPDGDTGTNMALTVAAAISELDASPAPEDLPEVCQAIAHGSLMGARGNSGVILCQVLRGLAEVFATQAKIGAVEFADGLAAGSDSARAAIVRPVEGTILTVAARAAQAACDSASSGDLATTVDAARAGARAALAATPELLPVLAQAGVVDAGGAGLVCLLDAFAAVVCGTELAELELPEDVATRIAAGGPSAPGAPSEDAGELRFEVMYFLEAADQAIGAFKDVWAGIGDSIVVVGGGGMWNCHIHTNDVGAAIEAALDVGRPRAIRVTDLDEQIEEERWVRQGSIEDAPASSAALRTTAVIAVATGDGVGRIFRSLGVATIVAGGQSMNPSTAEIFAAIDALGEGDVVLLPNNANIVPVARQAAALSSKSVQVVPTPGIQEGFAALLAYDPKATSAENGAVMTEAASEVRAGEVTRAVRDSTASCGPVRAGDFIGLARSGIVAVASHLEDATTGLIEALAEEGSEVVTLISGAGATPATTRRVTEWLAANHPALIVEQHWGGQALYPYLISIE